MYAQFFGNYLLSKGIITKDQLVEALKKKSTTKVKLGTLAIHAGFMTAIEVDNVVIQQTHENKRFGEIAISEGYLTEDQVHQLLSQQSPDFLVLAEVLIDMGIINNSQFQDLIIGYQSENDLEDFDYSVETQENIERMIDNLFMINDLPLSQTETDFYALLFNNLVRFIGDDYTMIPPIQVNEYPTNFCISQKVNGEFSVVTYIDMEPDVAIDFASRYVRENFDAFDEYVQSSLEDFVNLHNGMFNVNISNQTSMELDLEPPEVHENDLIVFDGDAYMLPIEYSFGTVYFIFDILKH